VATVLIETPHQGVFHVQSERVKVKIMVGYWQVLRSFSPNLQRFLIASAVVTTVVFGIQAVLQNLFLLRLGFDAKFIGLVLGLGQLVWAIAALPAGRVSNRLGLLNGWLVGIAFYTFGMGLMLLVENLPKPLWPLWLIGCQAIMMVGVALITVNIPPYLMFVTGEQERPHAFAVFQAIIPATAFAGSLLAGWLPGLFAGSLGMTLDQAAPYRLALWVGPILFLLATLPVWKADRGKKAMYDTQQKDGKPAPLGLLAFFGVLVYLSAISEGIVRTFFNVYLDAGLSVPPAQIGAIMGLAQLLPIGAALAVPIFMARWGTGYVLVVATLGIAASMLLLAVGLAVWMVASAYMAVIAMVTIMATARDMLGQELVTPRWRTTISAVAMIGLALGWSTASMAGGYLIEAQGYGALYFVGATLALLAVALLAGYLRTRRQQAPTKAIEQSLP
jgi:MFS family permease